jgi:GIY-YIG catalytic domain-containing protein
MCTDEALTLALSACMAGNALVSWIVRQRPWELEDTLIEALDLPLNLMGTNTTSPTPC